MSRRIARAFEHQTSGQLLLLCLLETAGNLYNQDQPGSKARPHSTNHSAWPLCRAELFLRRAKAARSVAHRSKRPSPRFTCSESTWTPRHGGRASSASWGGSKVREAILMWLLVHHNLVQKQNTYLTCCGIRSDFRLCVQEKIH